jgi:hypothetical protein
MILFLRDVMIFSRLFSPLFSAASRSIAFRMPPALYDTISPLLIAIDAFSFTMLFFRHQLQIIDTPAIASWLFIQRGFRLLFRY